jgi:hypothetical protein
MQQMLEERSLTALRAKIKVRSETPLFLADLEAPEVETKAWPFVHYDACKGGTLINVKNIRLRWVRPDWFEYIPMSKPFAFKRRSGELIEPKRMITDGGSIPRVAWVLKGLSPWGFVPAYIVHDWLCDRHYCGDTTFTFQAASDTMLEVIKTLMEEDICERDPLVFEEIQAVMHSPAAKRAWDNPDAECTLP